MRLTAHIDIETQASAGEAIPALERAIYDALDGLYVDRSYVTGSAPITELAVNVEEDTCFSS